ncbi:MAG: FkbM family methyltransferase [Roseobacter sp.]
MPAAAPETAAEPTFGTYAPKGGVAAALALTQRMPIARGKMRSITANWLDKVDEAVFDVQRWGANLRLRLDNVCERKALVSPASFDNAEIDALAAYLTKSGSVFIDIGSNAGLYPVRLLERNADLRIVAMEPNPTMLARLRAHLGSLNPHFAQKGRITVVPCGVSEGAGTASLHIDGENLGASGIAAKASNAVSIEIEVKPLLDILQENEVTQIDALKIDVEGHEDKALLPFLQVADDALLPRAILMEISHGDKWQGDMMQALADRGYRVKLKTRLNTLFDRTGAA